MRRSFRDGRRGFSPQNSGMKIGSMIALLVIVGLLYSRARRPETWSWLLSDNNRGDAAQAINSETTPTTTARRATTTARGGDSAAPRSADSPRGKPATESDRKPTGTIATSTAAPKATSTSAVSTAPEAVPQLAPTTTAATVTAIAVDPAPAEPKPPVNGDTVLAGPTDLDADEQAASSVEFELLTDREDLERNEMAAYWRLFRWAWAQSFADMEKRAQRHILYRQLWATPEKYRGKLILLRMHVKQIVKWEAPENRGGFKDIYEIWGSTDESTSYPYVVVVSELPPDMKIGANLHHEGVFVGYFLKNMAYRAHDVRRAAPLLVGRMHWQKEAGTAARDAAADHALWQWLAGGAMAVAAGVWLWLRFARLGKAVPVIAPTAEADMEAWFGHAPTIPESPGTPDSSGMIFGSSPTEPLPLSSPAPSASSAPSALPPLDADKPSVG